MKDRDLISRNIINILDVKHCREWEIFAGDDLYDQLYKYLAKLTNTEKETMSDIDKLMAKNELIIKKISQDKEITVGEQNQLMESLKAFKRKYLMKK